MAPDSAWFNPPNAYKVIATHAYVRKEDSFDAPNAYKVIATLDLHGDGKMEVVVGPNYYEGEEITICRCDPKKVEAYFLSLVARDNHLRYEGDLGISGHSDW